MEPDPMVTLLEKSLIVPATPTKTQHMFLSCLDIFWRDVHCNQRVIFYRPSGQDLSTEIETLKRSLSLVLVHFYPWAGRLAVGENRRLVIDCNDVGVEFVEASIDLPINALEKDNFQMKGFFEKLCQHVDYKNECLYTSPLLSVQATRFSDGGLALAVAQSHVIADGQSLWHLMVSWGECARGESLSLEPLHDRARLAVHDASPEKAVLKFEVDEDESSTDKATEVTTEKDMATEKSTASITQNGTMTEKLGASVTESAMEKPTEPDGAAENGASNGDRANSRKSDTLVQHTFHMSEAVIKKLKGEAAETSGRSFSSYEVLCAHFWQRVTSARRVAASERVNFATVANYRSRLTPPLPAAYHGNVVFNTTAYTDAATIAKESIGATAARIHAATVAHTEQRLRGLMHWLELNDCNLLAQFNFKGRFMMVSSSPRFPVYQVDFGWGRPAAVRPVSVPGDGEMVVFGGRPGSRAGDVEICMPLPADAMRNLLHDPLFLATSN